MSILLGHIMLFPDLKMRWSLLRILIHLIHEGMQHFTIDSGCVAFYLHVCLVFFTPSCRLIFDKRYLKNKCLFMVVTCQIISSLEQSSATVCWYPPFTIFSIYNFFSLCALRILDPTLRTEPTSKIALYYFTTESYGTFFISLFFSFFSVFVCISQPNCPPFP